MSSLPATTKVTVVPCLRYRDAPAAIEWLCRAFGFEKHAVYPGPDGTIAHAQLTFGNGMIMLGSVPAVETEFSRLIRQLPMNPAAPVTTIITKFCRQVSLYLAPNEG